jgi:hypothetical protein
LREATLARTTLVRSERERDRERERVSLVLIVAYTECHLC